MFVDAPAFDAKGMDKACLLTQVGALPLAELVHPLRINRPLRVCGSHLFMVYCFLLNATFDRLHDIGTATRYRVRVASWRVFVSCARTRR